MNDATRSKQQFHKFPDMVVRLDIWHNMRRDFMGRFISMCKGSMCKGFDIPGVITPTHNNIRTGNHRKRYLLPVIFTLEGIVRWNQDRALVAIDAPPTQHRTYNSALAHEVNRLSTLVYGEEFVPNYVPGSWYIHTGQIFLTPCHVSMFN